MQDCKICNQCRQRSSYYRDHFREAAEKDSVILSAVPEKETVGQRMSSWREAGNRYGRWYADSARIWCPQNVDKLGYLLDITPQSNVIDGVVL